MAFSKSDMEKLFNTLSTSKLNASRMIISQEDYDDIHTFDGICVDKSHAGYYGPISECSHPDCVVKHVLRE